MVGECVNMEILIIIFLAIIIICTIVFIYLIWRENKRIEKQKRDDWSIFTNEINKRLDKMDDCNCDCIEDDIMEE